MPSVQQFAQVRQATAAAVVFLQQQYPFWVLLYYRGLAQAAALDAILF